MNTYTNRKTNYYFPSVDLVAQVFLKNELKKGGRPSLSNRART